MTKSETIKQLAAASNEARLKELGHGIEALRTAKMESAEQLALMLEPLAQAMAALTHETLESIERRSLEQGERARANIETASNALSQASAQASQAARRMEEVLRRTEVHQYRLVALTAMITAMLVSVFWLWLAPPKVQNHLDAKAVADYLRPEIARERPSKDR